jgi:hypothetical protein
MAIQIDGTTPRVFEGGMTGRQMAEAFVNVRLSGASEVARALEMMAIRAGQNADKLLYKAAEQASRHIRDGYKRKINNVTDNLSKSVQTRPPKKKYSGVGVAITGPVVTGTAGASERSGSGNHAWLLEFGTGRRRPGTQGRRTYLNVHQSINRRMSKIGGGNMTFNNSQFERMGKGHYFLMGSKDQPTRQAKSGSGYPHDFGSDSPGEMHPITLQPGETYGAMPAQHLMEKTISENSGAVLSSLINTLNGYMQTITSGGNPLGGR